MSVAAAQLGVYNGMGVDADGERNGEQLAHYLEFAFEMISATITFWFCMDNKIRVDTMRLDIMLAEEGEQVIMCDPRGGEDEPYVNNTGTSPVRFSFVNVPKVTRGPQRQSPV